VAEDRLYGLLQRTSSICPICGHGDGLEISALVESEDRQVTIHLTFVCKACSRTVTFPLPEVSIRMEAPELKSLANLAMTNKYSDGPLIFCYVCKQLTVPTNPDGSRTVDTCSECMEEIEKLLLEARLREET